jgi:hypothetical protein
MGLALWPGAPRSIYRRRAGAEPCGVTSLRYALRQRQDGVTIRDLVMQVVQERRGYLDCHVQQQVDSARTFNRKTRDLPSPDFILRGGCTLLIDGETGLVRHVITKDILSDERLDRQRKYVRGDEASDVCLTYSRNRCAIDADPFGNLHRGFYSV